MSTQSIEPRADLAPTALYTAGVWAWAKLPCAELFDHRDARRVFGAVNLAMAVARPFQSRPPSLRHSLVQRHAMIDRLLAESGCAQVLELAAGLSPRGARVSADSKIDYLEIDRPEVLARKRALLARSGSGRAVLARKNLRFVEGDLAELSLPDAIATGTIVPIGLNASTGSPDGGPLCVIAEGLFVYLDAEVQRQLWERIRALFAERGGTLIFDLVPAVEQAGPSPIGRALGWLMRRFTRGGRFVRDARTRLQLLDELRAAGFETVRCFEPANAAPSWSLPFLDRRTQQLVFAAQVAKASGARA